MIRLLASQNIVSLETLWRETCQRMERQQEFRALNMIFAHLQDLQSRNFIREVDQELYELR